MRRASCQRASERASERPQAGRHRSGGGRGTRVLAPRAGRTWRLCKILQQLFSCLSEGTCDACACCDEDDGNDPGVENTRLHQMGRIRDPHPAQRRPSLCPRKPEMFPSPTPVREKEPGFAASHLTCLTILFSSLLPVPARETASGAPRGGSPFLVESPLPALSTHTGSRPIELERLEAEYMSVNASNQQNMPGGGSAPKSSPKSFPTSPIAHRDARRFGSWGLTDAESWGRAVLGAYMQMLPLPCKWRESAESKEVKDGIGGLS